MASVRFGLIGYGAWGSHHARAIAAVEDAELMAICARSEVNRQAAAAAHPRARLHADYRQMLAQEQFDVVSVVLPSDLHYEVGRAVLESGRHLLLEKPMALSVADCSALIDLAAARGRWIAVGHEFRFSPLWGKVKELIDAGAVGQPQYMLIELWRQPYRLGSGGWRYDIRRVGNWTLEEPIHFFDLARWCFSAAGNPTSVYARAIGRQPDRPELTDNFSALMAFPGGAYAVISQTLAGWEHHQIVKVTGTTGALWATWSGALDRTFQPTFRLQMLKQEEVVEVPLGGTPGEVYELVEEMRMVTQAIRKGALPGCTGEDGRWSVAMCLKAEESISLGRPVGFEEN
ncbi:MAG TPA: Gfo/Idh/MocA family oxidoreductase [Pirellulales bacterium]|nr:Gfo/Idh/MocA family oxidoreductase [Pirellulales bacterium]